MKRTPNDNNKYEIDITGTKNSLNFEIPLTPFLVTKKQIITATIPVINVGILKPVFIDSLTEFACVILLIPKVDKRQNTAYTFARPFIFTPFSMY